MKKLLYWLTLPRLLTAIVFIAIFTMAVRVPADTDTWWHLRSGQYILETRSIPTADPFSHTRGGQPWIDHGWLAQTFWYALFALGGWAGLSLGLAALVTIAFGLVWLATPGDQHAPGSSCVTTWTVSQGYIRAFSIILGAITSAVIWVARPQMVSFLLAGLVLLMLERYKRAGQRWVYAMPLVTLAWANIHGGYAIAFMLLAAYVVGETFNRLTGHRDDPVLSWRQINVLIGVAVVSFSVVAINPHGWQMWIYPFRTVGIGALRDYIQEWRSPNFHLTMTWPFVAMLMLTLAAMGRSPRRVDWTDLALVGMWGAGSLFAARNIGIFGLMVTPILARYAGAAWGHYLPVGQRPRGTGQAPAAKRRLAFAWLNWLLLGLVVLAALVKINLALAPSAVAQVEEETLPYGAVRFIQAESLPGPMFNSYNWGGYLIFRLWPEYPVYIDGRTDLYDDAFIRRYLNVMVAGDGWEQTLEDDGINLVLVESGSTPAKFLRHDLDWTEAYRDEIAVVFTR
jgi:hypothetical protein